MRVRRLRGKGLNKEEWYSICSRHQNYNEICDLCQCGRWINIHIQRISSIVFKLSPPIWRFFANL